MSFFVFSSIVDPYWFQYGSGSSIFRSMHIQCFDCSFLFSLSWIRGIRIRFSSTDPQTDPTDQNQCGSRYTTLVFSSGKRQVWLSVWDFIKRASAAIPGECGDDLVIVHLPPEQLVQILVQIPTARTHVIQFIESEQNWDGKKLNLHLDRQK